MNKRQKLNTVEDDNDKLDEQSNANITRYRKGYVFKFNPTSFCISTPPFMISVVNKRLSITKAVDLDAKRETDRLTRMDATVNLITKLDEKFDDLGISVHDTTRWNDMMAYVAKILPITHPNKHVCTKHGTSYKIITKLSKIYKHELKLLTDRPEFKTVHVFVKGKDESTELLTIAIDVDF